MNTMARKVAETLMLLIDQEIEDFDEIEGAPELSLRNSSTHTYDELGILTTDAGFVIRTTDGSEYQVTVVKSK